MVHFGKNLHPAQDLAKEQKINFGDDIAAQLRIARRKRWNAMEEKRISREVELHSYLNRLILEDRDKEIEKLREDKALDDTDDKAIAEIEKMSDVRTAELNSLFVKMDERRQVIDKSRILQRSNSWKYILTSCLQKREVPDYLCGKISFDLLRDPVITPSGITYDRKDIVEHLMVIFTE